MTRKFRQSETQTGFSGWLRNNPRLDSIAKHVVAVDSDLWVHKYKTIGDRKYQFLMLVEVKEFGKEPDPYQLDTLHIINQLLRNRRNIKDNWNAIDGRARISSVYSLMNKDRIQVTCFGCHVLRIDGDGTFLQWSNLTWDNKKISPETLEDLLLFNVDPDTLSPLDHRPDRRHKTVTSIISEETELGFECDRLLIKKS